jgi:hypothetical protein
MAGHGLGISTAIGRGQAPISGKVTLTYPPQDNAPIQGQVVGELSPTKSGPKLAVRASFRSEVPVHYEDPTFYPVEDTVLSVKFD